MAVTKAPWKGGWRDFQTVTKTDSSLGTSRVMKMVAGTVD